MLSFPRSPSRLVWPKAADIAMSAVGDEPLRPMRPLSTRVTRTPNLAASMAAMQAADPPPMMRTSVLTGERFSTHASQILPHHDLNRLGGACQLAEETVHAALCDEAGLVLLGRELQDIRAAVENAAPASVAFLRINLRWHG